MPGCSHSLSSDTAQQFHIIMWRKECLPDPTSFYISAPWPMCILWAPRATRFWPSWQVLVSKPESFLHPASICSNVSSSDVVLRWPLARKRRCLSMPSCWKKLEGISSCLRESLMHESVCPSSAPCLHSVQTNKRMPPTAVKVKLCLEIWPKCPGLSSGHVKKEGLLHKDNKCFSSLLCVFSRVLIYYKFKDFA